MIERGATENLGRASRSCGVRSFKDLANAVEQSERAEERIAVIVDRRMEATTPTIWCLHSNLASTIAIWGPVWQDRISLDTQHLAVSSGSRSHQSVRQSNYSSVSVSTFAV